MPPLKPIIIAVFYFILFNHLIQLAAGLDLVSLIRRSSENWNGQWFPNSPQETDNNPIATLPNHLHDAQHGVKMGISNPSCDDAKTNLTVDWDSNPINHTCFSFSEKLKYRARDDISPTYWADFIPPRYSAPHKCMNEKIDYPQIIPSFGTHRPLWAKYGEYTFVPRQRWIHNLEHGAVVMLYHPCADKNEVNLLRKIVTKCLYRHVITPYNLLPSEKPLALVSWGHVLTMSKVEPNLAVEFIKNHALNGPEKTSRDGQYDVLLKKHADVVSDIDDTELCRAFDFSKITM